jgi:1-acyl-sn-glycerol-3-phosphate acyltransferase
MIYHLLPRDDLIVMAAEKYEKSAIARWVGLQFDAIFIDRYNADFRALREVLRRLQKGGMLVMAPEGTRSHTMALLKGQHGAAYLGAKTGVPIIPAAIVGSEDEKVYAFWKKLRRAPMDVYIGDPFTLPPLPKKNKEEAVEEYTSELMCRIAALLPPQYRGEYANHPRLVELLDGDLSKILKP